MDSKTLQTLTLFVILAAAQAIDYEVVQKTCTQHISMDPNFDLLSFKSLITNTTKAFNTTLQLATQTILTHHNQTLHHLNQTCQTLEDYPSTIHTFLQSCQVEDFRFETLRSDMEASIISVLYNLNELKGTCAKIWGMLRHPIACSAVGHIAKLKASCKFLRDGMETILWETEQRGKGAECCLQSRIKEAMDGIDEIAKDCKKE